jgi:hypothetical protein
MNLPGTPLIEYLPALGLALFTAIFLTSSYTYSVQARAFPTPVAWVSLVLTALDIVTRTQTAAGVSIRRHFNPGAQDPERSHPLGKQVAAALWLAIFAIALALIGVLNAVPLYMFASLRFQGRRSWFTSLWISVVVTAALWLLFAVLLRLELYPGYLFGGA